MDTTTANQQDTPSFAPKLYGIALLVCILVLVGLWSMSRYITLDLARDLESWQEKLGLIAESRQADIETYVSTHFKDLHTLADNPSLQLYLTELETLPSENKKSAGEKLVEPAQLSYLRNLLLFTAERSGYLATSPLASIPANIDVGNASGGLAIINSNNEIVVSTPLDNATKDNITTYARNHTGAQEQLIDINKQEDGNVSMGFIVPIFSIQGEKNDESVTGKIVAIKRVDNNFYSLLKHPGTIENSLEAYLIRNSAGQIEYLSPLKDKTAPLTKTNPNDKGKFAEAYLLDAKSSFSSELNDYTNKKVLATSRKIKGTPWTMVVKTERDEALKSGTERRTNMMAILFLLLLVITLLIIAMWWYSSSRRSLMMSYHYRKLATQSMAQEKLLQLVADNQPESIFIIDATNHFRFANQNAAKSTGMVLDSLLGKNATDVLGAARADQLVEHCKDSFAQKKIITNTSERFDPQQNKYVIQSSFVPLAHIPLGEQQGETPGVLVVEQDITEVVAEREKRISLNQSLITTLVTLVDRRDPFAANHSLIVSGLATHVATEMALDAITIDTTRIAASLMNVGKIVVPRALLTKTDRLTDEERLVVRDSMYDSAELVRNIVFDGPVYETLKQWQEHIDGSGPLGKRGEAILISARILNVANTFVGMISPRSWRHAISHEEATKFLMNKCDELFDRRVVVALVHFLENQKGREWLASVISKKDAA